MDASVTKCLPILFSSPMIRAILDGRKSMTRRVMKPHPENLPFGRIRYAGHGIFRDAAHFAHHAKGFSPYQPGDRLWVRETWAAPHAYDHMPPRFIPATANFHHAATEERGGLLWRPSVHMPRWASRITLLVTAVRVERLQDISEADAIAEGIERDCCNEGWRNYTPKRSPFPTYGLSPQKSFCTLWQSLNAKRPGCSWEDNPFVWVVEFEQMKGGAA